MNIFRRRMKDVGETDGSIMEEISVPALPGLSFKDEQPFASLGKDHLVTDSTIAMDNIIAKAAKPEDSRPHLELFDDEKKMMDLNATNPNSPSVIPPVVPFHLPWTRRAFSPASVESNKQQKSTVTTTPSAASPRKATKAPHSAFTDFRVSPSYAMLKPKATDGLDQVKKVEYGRRQSLKRSRAPTDLSILVAGARSTGKTSWIRALLSTCDLSKCSSESRNAALFFGVSTNDNHPTRQTDPVTPLRTDTYTILERLDLLPDSLIPIPVLSNGNQGWSNHLGQHEYEFPSNSTAQSGRRSALSHSRSSVSGGSNKVQLSICDTPGIDFEVEDSYEIERKVVDLLHYVEDRLFKTLSEETKVQRTSRGNGHIHLVLFFIDPRYIIENIEARRKEKERERYKMIQEARTRAGEPKTPRKIQSYGSPRYSRRTASDTRTILHESRSTASLREAAQNADAEAEMNGYISEKQSDFGVANKLPANQVSILARLSRRSNVLPVIAKADTLTAAELELVKAAVQRSVMEAGIDLGTFGVPLENDLKEVKVQSGRKMDGARNQSECEDGVEQVKVCRIRRRRTYSLSGSAKPISGAQAPIANEQRAASLSRPESAMTDYETTTGGSPVEPSTPLAQSAQLTEPTHERFGQNPSLDSDEVVNKIPLAIFVPEPVRVRSGMQPPTPQMSPNRDVPPVPTIPRSLSRNSIRSISSSQTDHMTNRSTVPTNNGSDLARDDGDNVVEEIDDTSSIAGSHFTSSHHRHRFPDTPFTRLRSEQMPRGNYSPLQSRRYVRDFRFGQANILDSSQCDFALLRTCLLGSHISELREHTAILYEQFRSERLEMCRSAICEAKPTAQEAIKKAEEQQTKQPSLSSPILLSTSSSGAGKMLTTPMVRKAPGLPQASPFEDLF